jgi:hypothetical protein
MALSFFLLPEVSPGPVVQSGLYANPMMVLVNNRIFIPCNTSSMENVELGVINETASTQLVVEGLIDGEPVQA